MENNNAKKVALNDELLDKVAGGSCWGDPEFMYDPSLERYQQVRAGICPDCGEALDFKGTGCYMCSCGACFVTCV